MRVASDIARAPAFHFLVLGTALFAIQSFSAAAKPTPVRDPIVITATRVEEIRDDYARMIGTPPTPVELAALIDKEADDEMLYREALLLGLDRGDPAVEWRVIEKMEFLYGDAAGDNAEALRHGLELGLQRDDVVVRTGLIVKMRLLARGTSRLSEPTGAALDQDLEEFFHEHRDDYVHPEAIDLVHVFFRGDIGREPEARAVRQRLEAKAAGPAEALKEGDPFAAGNEFRATTHGGLVKVFGEGFADRAFELEPNRWSEPVLSPFGVHLVRVNGKSGSTLPSLDAVRSQVLQAYRAERQKKHLEQLLAEIRAAYEVRIEQESPTDG